MITDRASFERYRWPDPDAFPMVRLAAAAAAMPTGMKLMVSGPCGVLENVTFLLGFERLCLLQSDDPDLLDAIFAAVGSRLLCYYQRALENPAVGLLMSNDDWGHKGGTFLSPRAMRRWVFPWHERIVAAAHAKGIPAVLHSCGNLAGVMDDLIDGLGFDGKHSYEDGICRVEEAYERWGGRIAILGGLDVDFMVRADPAAIRSRAEAMLARSHQRGGYGLGTGNSVPEYIPDEHYLAMNLAATASRR